MFQCRQGYISVTYDRVSVPCDRAILPHDRAVGAHRRGTGPSPPWDLKNALFLGFLPLNYVISIFEVCFLLCGRTEEACSMVKSLRKVDFSRPTDHYI